MFTNQALAKPWFLPFPAETIHTVTERRKEQKLHKALFEISEASHSAGDLLSLLKHIHQIVSGLIPANNFYVALYDESSKELSFPYFVDEHDAKPQPRKLNGTGLTEKVFRSGEALLLTPELLAPANDGKGSYVGSQCHAWLGVPLKTQERTIGVLAVQSYSGLVRYTEPDKELLQFVSSHVATTLERNLAEQSLNQANKDLAAREILLKQVLDTASVAIFLVDMTGHITQANRRMAEMFCCSTQEIEGKEYVALIDPQEQQLGRQKMLELLNSQISFVDLDHRYRCADGSQFWGHLAGKRFYDPEGQELGLIGVISDITSMKEHQSQLEHIAHFDTLTGLPNRVLLADRLQQAMLQSARRGNSLAVAYLDLDGFKAVNDRYGHDHGDELLIKLAERMKTALREGDTLARIGGDEFVAIMVDLEQPQDCDLVLLRLLQAVAAPVNVRDNVLQVSASLGVTLYPRDGADADLLLRHADQAMYAAKQAGKNRYHLFDLVQDAAIQTRHESVEHIRRALDNKEFVLYYQPKVNMKTGQVTGAEALIRWQHPERGLLQPDAFLPIIENHPISVELGEWVIDSTLAQISDWHAQGLVIPVSVNISAFQLQAGNFATRLSALLGAHPDVAPGYLELEVLETSALEDIAQVSGIMSACQVLGVRFSLDDFGTGYSSLTYLKLLTVETLKIDQSFVRDMLGDSNDLAIVKGVIGLAKAFGRQVIAEGVETAAHGNLLLSIGCEQAQGYGIARPLPAGDLPGWAKSWQAGAVWAD